MWWPFETQVSTISFNSSFLPSTRRMITKDVSEKTELFAGTYLYKYSTCKKRCGVVAYFVLRLVYYMNLVLVFHFNFISFENPRHIKILKSRDNKSYTKILLIQIKVKTRSRRI